MGLFIFILKIIFGSFFIFAGVMHFLKPHFFKHFIPDFLPKLIVNYIFGIIEIILGFGLFFPLMAKNAAIGVFILMIVFLPIHIWDLFKEKPAIGSKKLAIIRIPLQFLFIYFAYLIYINS